MQKPTNSRNDKKLIKHCANECSDFVIFNSRKLPIFNTTPLLKVSSVFRLGSDVNRIEIATKY